MFRHVAAAGMHWALISFALSTPSQVAHAARCHGMEAQRWLMQRAVDELITQR